jgi:hypothetical protein
MLEVDASETSFYYVKAIKVSSSSLETGKQCLPSTEFKQDDHNLQGRQYDNFKYN